MPRISVPADQVFPILKENILVDGFHLVIDLEKSHGSYMVDALEGKEYLDCYSYFASLPVGHNHPKMRDEEFLHSLAIAALTNPANSDVYSREYAAFVKTFREIAAPPEFRYLFFVAGGSVAVANAMKVAFDWKSQLNRSRGIDVPGDKILHFLEAFHGRTGYALSVTNTEPLKIKDYPKFDWPRVPNPKLSFPVDETAVLAAEQESLGAIRAAFEKDPHGIAAILIEPIQGEGGDNHFRAEFLLELRRLADIHDALLIYDEIQTGAGATGTMWAYQQLGATPDVIAFGKKTQVCGVMSTTRVDSVPSNVFHVSSRINSTWGGNLVDMVRGARYLQIIQEDGLLENVAKVGAVFKHSLLELQERCAIMSNVRGRGLMLAFDVPDGETRKRIQRACWERGLAVLICGPRSIRFRPPLTFGETEVQRAIEVLRDVLT